MSALSIYQSRPTHLDPLEINILNQREAFDLPPQQICGDLVGIFFQWISPVLPVVNKNEFLRRYHDPEDPPSILLLQAIFMAASRFYPHEGLNSSIAPRAFYKKAKALYDAGYELNGISVLQAVLLMSIYWDGPDDLTENGLFYWSRLGVVLAQSYGLHREKSMSISRSENRLRRRIWWTLYTRDRAVAAAFGRPLHIDLGDCTVEPLTENDFVEDDDLIECLPDKLHVQFFLKYIKLCQLMEEGLCLRLSSRSTRANRATEAAQCELGLSEWLGSCPAELRWQQPRHNFWAAVLQSTFNAIVCQKHLLQTPYSSEESKGSASQSASTIVSIMETLQANQQLQYSPSFIICHSLVSFAMLKSQINSEAPSLLHTIKSKLDVNLDILSELCRTWPIATMLLELFQTITYQGQFDRALELAIENCRKRANGETDSHLRTKPFKRARMSQVILPENRLVLQVLPRESQKQSTSFQSPVTNTEDAARSEVPNNADTNAVLDELGFSWDNADPSIILRNIREFARTGELGVHSGSLRDAYE